MAVRTPAQVIEVFHLLFLRVLASDRQDWFVLKGGANIRYFFDSERYSNDIDLDFYGREAWKVGETVNKILEGTVLKSLAQAQKIAIAQTSAPKQTDITRRWKVGLAAEGHVDQIRTKIEFSNRNGASDDILFEVVPNSIVQPYGVLAPSVVHYGETAAIEQKIAALALRSETKARDVFDLDLLLRRRATGNTAESAPTSQHAADAALRALEIPYGNFDTEVVPFLDVEIAALYDELEWDQMRTRVASSLTEIANTTGSDQ